MDISVIIVNYNTIELTKNCVESIIRNTKEVSYEIILVDNGSKDGSKEYFEKDKRITYIYSEENLGFGRANNLGLNYSKGSYIFLLNSDTLLIDNALYKIYKETSSTKIPACYGVTLVDNENRIIHSYGNFPTLRTFIRQYLKSYCFFLFKKSSHENDLPLSKCKVDYITGADLWIDRRIINKLGLFNPNFFMYYEETEMQKRYSQHGFYSYILPNIRIKHLEGSSFKKRKISRLQMVFAGSIVYAKLCFPRIQYILFRVLTVILNLPKILVYPGSIKDKIKTISILLNTTFS